MIEKNYGEIAPCAIESNGLYKHNYWWILHGALGGISFGIWHAYISHKQINEQNKYGGLHRPPHPHTINRVACGATSPP